MRKTKIICTIGPASNTDEMVKELMLAGMNVARFNFSHGDHAEQGGKFERIMRVSATLGLPVATLQDTRGPEIRLCNFADEKVTLEEGQLFTLTTEDILGTKEIASITYKGLKNDVAVGSTVLIDDGKIGMTVEKIEGENIVCRVLNGGDVSNKKGINAPGVVLTMPFVGEADYKDLVFGAKLGFDFVALSFTRTREDVLEVRKILEENNSHAKIIAKIESVQGINNLDEILEVADGIMVARGDMGVEVPFEDVPVIQKEMIKKAVACGKHVITATQMLESMISNPRPTRAETTDVANAIYDGTTAIMLSGESAQGKYPLESVQAMARIARRAEKDIDYVARFRKRPYSSKPDITTAISHATCTTAMDLDAAAIITVSMSGRTVGKISKYKPNCPVIGCSVNPRVCRQLNMAFGVQPILIDKKETADDLFEEAAKAAEAAGYIKKGDIVVLTAGVPLGIAGNTNMIRVLEI